MAAATSGCKFSASASGEVKSGGDAKGSAEASLTTEEEKPDKGPITYREGQLDYKGTINFEYDKATLQNDPATQETLREFAAFLQKHADVNIEIEGHTDSRGSDDYNRDLSDRRAATVRQWLIDNGVAEERLTAIGKGEDEPQVPEPAECDDQRPEDTTPCEDAWGKNRRVVFQVTSGAKTLEEPAPEPVAEAEPEPEPEKEECPWLYGGHLNLLGPNSWVIGAGAIQPGICWLEPSLGLGLGFGGVEADNAAAGSGDGSYVVLNVPLRARFWFMETHSLIGDLGLGLSNYWISADMTDLAMGTAEYSRDSLIFYGNAGLGYGWRPNKYNAGFRLGIVIGGLLHFGDLADSETTPAMQNLVLQGDLDADTDGLTDLEPYGEISLGWLFE